MSTYPQGVSSFIPDYQPYEPDFNFALNALQLKQTQYDQNWSKLNNIYGQIVHAPLSHGESINRRTNTLNAIDFDLKRVTGLDLSLDQNVHQATQIFRPFYEDQSLMKDMAFTKNAMHERNIGMGKRASVDPKIRDEYWDGGVRLIDEKIKDFQSTPYDQLPSFGDVRYVPYVNVEKKAFELAEKFDYTIDMTTPTGEWMIRERNGKQVIPRLQSVFYSILGKDPMIQEMYGAQAYLKRKDYIAANMNNPEFKGDAAAAERHYLENALGMLQKQTQVIKSQVTDDKISNDVKIKRLEAQVKSGDNSIETKTELERLKKANQVNEDVLNSASTDNETVNNNRNKTLTTRGGSDLSFDDLENMRMRVDGVMGSMMLQADLNKAAEDVAYKDYLLDYEANPFAVQRQKYLYDVDLLNKRKEYQKEVDAHKAELEKQKVVDEARIKSGLYYRDLDSGDVKIKPEFEGAHKLGIISDTDVTDPIKLQKILDDAFLGKATVVKNKMRNVLEKMLEEGTLSGKDLNYILGDKVSVSGFDMAPFLDWLNAHGGEKDGPVPKDIRENLRRQGGSYVTDLEKEMGGDLAGYGQAKLQLLSLALGKLDDVSPEYLKRMTTRLGQVISNMSADEKIRNNTTITALNQASYGLDNYVEYEKAVRENYKKLKNEVVAKLKGDNFKYGEAFFDPRTNRPVATQEEFLKNALTMFPNDIEVDNGLTFAEWVNSMLITGSATGAMASPATLGIGFLPGFAIGFLGAGIVTPVASIFEQAYNTFFGGDTPADQILLNNKFKDSKTGKLGGAYNLMEEFEGMQEAYDALVKSSEIKTTPIGLATKPLQGGGTGYTVEATGVYILPGARGQNYNQWLELQKVIDNNLDLMQPGENSWVSFNGPEAKYDDLSSWRGESDIASEQYRKFKAIYDDLKMETATAPPGDKEASRFEVGIVPFASGRADLASVIIKMPKTFLDKYYDPKAEGGSFLTTDEYQSLLKNGFNIITDAKKLSQTTMYQNAFLTDEEVSVRRAGGKGKTYTSWTAPGFSVNYKVDPADDSKILVSKSAPVYMGPGEPYTQQTSYENVRLGSNIAYDREKFFNEDVLKIMSRNYQLEQEYGTAGQSE